MSSSQVSAPLPPQEASPPRASPSASVEGVQKIACAVRRRVLEYTLKNNGGYLSQACSSAETLACLYARALKLGPPLLTMPVGPFRGSPCEGNPAVTGELHNGDFNDPDSDRIIFSPVHYALVLYSLLVEVGRLDPRAFDSYNQDGSTVELIGAEHSPGHAVTAGSLGQALSQGAGIAYARKLKGHTGRVVVYMSDGEFQEGQTWEALQASAFHRIGNLVAVVDVNKQQCDGAMADVMDAGNLADKAKAFGADVRVVDDGHDVEAITEAIESSREDSTKPTVVFCMTDPCRGFPELKERAPKLHYVRFKDADEKRKWENILARMDVPVTVAATNNNKDDGDEKKQEDDAVGSAKRKAEEEAAGSNKVAKAAGADPVESVTTATNARLIETVTRPHRSKLVEWAKKHPKAIVLTADLTSSCEADLLRDTLPDQYLSCGMAEQHMMSFAGGLAREGFHPYVHTFGVFIARRPYDQVAMSIGVPNLPVRMLGFLPGLTTPGGVTHQSIDDTSLMRSIPNVRVLEVADATEVESVLDVAESVDGPVYVRMLRGQVPRLFPKNEQMKFGQVRILSEGTDVAVVTAGICTEEAIKAREAMGNNSGAGVSIKHLHLSTLVPFPSEIVAEAASRAKYGVVVMENHSVVGGIGSMTAEAMAECGGISNKKLVRLGVRGYAHGASKEYLMREYKIDSRALIEAIEGVVGRKLVVVDGDNATGGQAAAEVAELAAEERPEDL